MKTMPDLPVVVMQCIWHTLSEHKMLPSLCSSKKQLLKKTTSRFEFWQSTAVTNTLEIKINIIILWSQRQCIIHTWVLWHLSIWLWGQNNEEEPVPSSWYQNHTHICYQKKIHPLSIQSRAVSADEVISRLNITCRVQMAVYLIIIFSLVSCTIDKCQSNDSSCRCSNNPVK